MRQERPPTSELDPSVVAAYAATFISRRDVYSIQLDNGTYVSVQKELTDDLIAAHLRGYITIGTYPLDEHGWGKWLCMNADTEKHWKGLLRLAGKLQKASVVPYLEPSRRGGHLWLFAPTIPGFQIRQFGKELLSANKLPVARGKVPGIEIYPKQDRPVTGPGSLIRLPLGIYRLTNKRYHFINTDGTPLAPTIRDQIRLLGNPQLVPQEYIDLVLAEAPEPKVISPTPSFDPKPETLAGNTVSERLKNRISVKEFVNQYVELDANGKGKCPFHPDDHKSFSIDEEHNYWHCFAGCGGGSIIDFWMKYRDFRHQKGGFKAAVRDLAKMLL